MMLRQYLTIAALFLLLVSNISFTFANDDNQAQTVRKTVESYCKIEFDGAWVPARWAIIKFGQKRKVEREYDEVLDSAVFSLGEHYPFIVTASYEIKEVKVMSPKRATAQVLYRRVAHSASATGREWYLVPDPMDNDLVTLNLIYDKNKWYVLDPPSPRISRDWLIEHYEERIKSLGVENHPKWQKERDTVKLLKSLP